MTIKIALAQFVSTEDGEETQSRIVEKIVEAAALGARLVAFHELATTPYFCYEDRNDTRFALAETIPGPSTERIGKACDQHGISVVFPLYERDGERRFNTATLIEPRRGVVDLYRKMHVPHSGDYGSERGADESYYFSPGDTGFLPWESATGLRIGVLICYDRHFFEGARAYGLQGVQIVFVPTATYRKFIVETLWEVELQAMAFQNSFYVAGINKVGPVLGSPDKSYPGQSVIVDPEGRIVARADDREGLITADVDPEAPGRCRDYLRLFQHRRPAFYGAVSQA